MADGERNRRPRRVHPRAPANDFVGVPPDAPSLLRLAHHAAHGIGDDLMAEADADHRRLRLKRAADEVPERIHPGR